MRQDQAAQAGNLHLVPGFLALHVGPAEQDQRRALAACVFPVAFHGGQLGRLMLQRVQAMQVADHGLDGRDDQQHRQAHRHHLADGRIIIAAQQMPGGRRHHQQGRGEEGGHAHVQQPVRERGIEDDGQPVHGHHAPVDDFMALRRLHPAVRGDDPGGRDQGTQRHHGRGEHVQAWPHAVPAEQHHAEEARFQEEGRQHFIGQQRACDAARIIGKETPVGAELVSHDEAGNDAHAEIDGENLRPEVVQVAVHAILRAQPRRLQYRQVTGQADGDGGKNNVK